MHCGSQLVEFEALNAQQMVFGGVVRMDIETVSKAFALHAVCYTKSVVQCILCTCNARAQCQS